MCPERPPGPFLRACGGWSGSQQRFEFFDLGQDFHREHKVVFLFADVHVQRHLFAALFQIHLRDLVLGQQGTMLFFG